MKKVLFITGSLPPMKCGVGHYTSTLLRHMGVDKVDTAILTGAEAGDLAEGRTIIKAPGWGLIHIFSLVSLARSFKPEVIHIQYPAVGYGRKLGINLLPLLLRLSTRAKVYVTLHEYFGSSLLGRIRDFGTVLWAHKVIVSNEADRKSLSRYFKNKLFVVPLGPNIESGSPDLTFAREVVGLKRGFDSEYLLFFGYPFPAKKIENLIKAMDDIPDKKLVIVAGFSKEDSYQNKLLKEIASSPAKSRIKVVDFLPADKLVSLLKTCFCFVLPQDVPLNAKSGTSIAAAINGLPVAGKRGHSWENAPFKDGENSILLPLITPEVIASSISELAADRERYDTVARGSASLSSVFSWDTIVKKHISLYEKGEL